MDPPYQALLAQLTSMLEASSSPPESQLASCLSESWFSNTLAWYLDPRAGHRLGTRGADLFLKIVARARLASSHRQASTVKWGKSGKGRGATTFNLGNAAVIREFFLAGGVRESKQRGPRYCDLVLLDLDPSDGLFVVVENKLFTCNRPGQLTDYEEAVEHKFYRVKTREYVYLTLGGHEPAYAEEDHLLGDDSDANS